MPGRYSRIRAKRAIFFSRAPVRSPKFNEGAQSVSGSGFGNDVFISYAHLDNQPFGEDGKRWVNFLHENLENFVNVRLGRRSIFWRDSKVTGADVFTPEIHDQLRRSAVLVSVVSRSYIESDWCRREITAFQNAAEAGGGLVRGNKHRIVKVLKAPPLDRRQLPEVLDRSVGFPFYRVDAAANKARDYLIDPSPDAAKAYLAMVDDVAQDIVTLLDDLRGPPDAPGPSGPSSGPLADPKGESVYLAEATSDLKEESDQLRREFEARGFQVVPGAQLPLVAAEMMPVVRSLLAAARISVHLVGGHYGVVPEGADRSVTALQWEVAREISGHRLRRVAWLLPGDEPADTRQMAFCRRLQRAESGDGNFELLTNSSIEVLKMLVLDELAASSAVRPARPNPGATPSVYLLCDAADRPEADAVRGYLLDHEVEVALPLTEGTADEIREDHYENLQLCDAVLILWGEAREAWVRAKLRDLIKVAGMGRTRPFKAKTICISDPPTHSKEYFRTNEATLVRASRSAESGSLAPFLVQLRAAA